MSLQQTIAQDLATVAAEPLGAGTNVLFTPQNGAPVTLRGWFIAAGSSIAPSGASAPIATTSPMLHLPVAALASVLSRKLNSYDTFTINGTTYTPRHTMSNGCGMYEIPLQQV